MRSAVERIADKALRVAQEALDEAKLSARKNVAHNYKLDIESAYTNAVDAWYEAYTPHGRKKYVRTHQLYGILKTEIDDDWYVNWEMDDDLQYRSLFGGTWDPFNQLVERGLHGGWFGHTDDRGIFHAWHSPTKSTPIVDLFDDEFAEVEDSYRSMRFTQIQKEFYDIFWSKYS